MFVTSVPEVFPLVIDETIIQGKYYIGQTSNRYTSISKSAVFLVSEPSDFKPRPSEFSRSSLGNKMAFGVGSPKLPWENRYVGLPPSSTLSWSCGSDSYELALLVPPVNRTNDFLSI